MIDTQFISERYNNKMGEMRLKFLAKGPKIHMIYKERTLSVQIKIKRNITLERLSTKLIYTSH